MSYIVAADAATPPHLALLPRTVSVMMAYVGQRGETPHVWSAVECQHYRDAGKKVWPIWVPPQDDFAQQYPADAAAGLHLACQERDIPKLSPVFLDIEKHGWDADPAAASRYLAQWKVAMTRLGYRHPFGYLPLAAGRDWVAHWTGRPPASLPAGWVGQQYANDLAAGAYDLSVFDPARLGITVKPRQAGAQIEGQLDMFLIHDAATGVIDLVDGNARRHRIGSPDTVAAMRTAGIPYVEGADPRDVAAFPVEPAPGE